MTEPLSNDQIVVHAEHSDEVVAERADLHVSVEGSRLSTGGEALAQVREVKAFVAALHQLGVDDVALEALQGRTTSGFLGRSSAATYMLRVRVRPGQLGEVLDVLASMEDVRLTRTEWRFPASADRQGERLAACAQLARRKAEAAAAVLGAKVVGVIAFEEERAEAVVAEESPRMLGTSKTKKGTLALRVPLRQRVTTRVRATFRVE